MLNLLFFALTTVGASSVNERVNCAGALSTGIVASVVDETFNVGPRQVRVLISPKSTYYPPEERFIELPMATDRVPTFSTRLRPALRFWKMLAFNGLGLEPRRVLQYEVATDGVLTSETIGRIAVDMTNRGYTEESSN